MMFRFATIVTLLFASVKVNASDHDDSVLHWASSGGGWRAMVANMGFASAFYQAGLLTEKSSEFASASANSGGAWSMLQLFYSDPFFSKVLVDDPDLIYDFVVDWMNDYKNVQRAPNPLDPRCAPFAGSEVIPGLEILPAFCVFFGSYDYDWSLFIQEMLNATSIGYGDPGLVDRSASHENRVAALKDTDLYIQMGIAPSSSTDDSETAYLGPNSDPSSTYSVILPMQYAVKKDRTHFNYGVEDEDLPFLATTASTPDGFNLSDWSEFYLFPAINGNVLTTLEDTTTGSAEFREPFGGDVPNIAQLAGVTSSAAAFSAPWSPSFYAQFVSTLVFVIQNAPGLPDEQKATALGIAQSVFDYVYQAPLFVDMSICSQWPNECGKTDARLIDGGNTDGPTLSQSIGQHQTVNKGDLSKPLKIILTNHNVYTNTNVKFLEYFNTVTNQGIDPGDFNWEASVSSSFPVAYNPTRSKQIFAEPLDDETMLSAFVKIPGTNLTTAVYEATTIDNPAFKVKAGQKVEILLVQINSNIPNEVYGPQTESFIVPLAELAQVIAGSEELVSRIKDFVGTDDDVEKPSPSTKPKGKGKGMRRKRMHSKNKSKSSKSTHSRSKGSESKSVHRKKKSKRAKNMKYRGLRA